jgi:hypothetical protein
VESSNFFSLLESLRSQVTIRVEGTGLGLDDLYLKKQPARIKEVLSSPDKNNRSQLTSSHFS